MCFAVDEDINYQEVSDFIMQTRYSKVITDQEIYGRF